MGLQIIRDVKDIFRVTSGRLLGRLTPGLGRGEELTAKQVSDWMLPPQAGHPVEALLTDGVNTYWGLPTSSSVDNSQYTFSSTTIAPPSNGQIRYNNTVISLVTAAYVDKDSDAGIDLTNYYRKITPGTIFWMQDKDNALAYQRWSINSVQEHANYFEWGVTMLDQGLLVPNNSKVITSYVRVGQDGVSLNDLLDVVITTPASTEVLRYNGTNWINAPLAMSGGTVTNTGGALTANAIVIGAGVNDTKVAGGLTTDGISQINLGLTSSVRGKLKFSGETSGDVSLHPAASQASGNILTLPGTTGTLATQAYADSLVAGLLNDRGNYNASTNVFPSTGGSGAAGAVEKGDLWVINVAGTLGGVAVTPGDTARALVNTPGQTASNWAILENNIGFTPLSAALASGRIYVGNASGIGTAVLQTGDVTMSNAGVTAIGAAKVTNAMLAGSITAAKLVKTDITTVGTITIGTWSAGAVIGRPTMTLGADAVGDVYYRDATGKLTNLPIGSTNSILKVIAGLPSWASLPLESSSFGTVAVSGQLNVIADSVNDILTLAAGAGIAITTDPVTDTVTITSTLPGGDVVKVGVPADNQVGVWTGDGTIEGAAALTYNSTTSTLSSVNFAGNLAGNVTGNASTVTTNANLTGPVTSVGNATTIQPGAVTLAMQANMATASVVYRKTAAAGAPEVQTLATLKTDLGLTGTNAGDQLTFGTVAVSGQSNVVADLANDTLTLVAGTNITITTDPATDSITINSTAAGGGGGTVTNTAGALSPNRVVLGAGTADVKVNQGLMVLTGTGTIQLIIGENTGPTAGSINLRNATSGVTQIFPHASASAADITLPPTTGTLVTLTGTETLTSKTLTSPVITTPTINLGTNATGDIYYRNAGGLFTRLAIGATNDILKVTAGIPAWSASGGGGTVTNTGGVLTNNSVVLGAGTADTKVISGITTDGISRINLGSANKSGQLKLSGNTSGDAILQAASSGPANIIVNMPSQNGYLTTVEQVEAGYQPLSPNLSVLSALVPTTNNFIQSKSGAWTSRTVAQVKADLDPFTFGTIAVSGQSNVVADVANDTLTLVAGTGVTITTNATTDTITISSTGGGGGGGVTNPEGALELNKVVIGAGGSAAKTLGGFSVAETDGVGSGVLTLGLPGGSKPGQLKMWSPNTSGSVTLFPNEVNYIDSAIYFPNYSGMIATVDGPEILLNKTIVVNSTIRMESEITGMPPGTTHTMDLTKANHQTIGLMTSTGTVTLTLTVPLTSAAGTIIVKQFVGGAHGLVWAVSSGTIKWMGTQPAWASDPSGSVRIVRWRYDGSVMYLEASPVGT